MLALLLNVAAWAIVLTIVAVGIAGLIALWRTIWPVGAAVTLCLVIALFWMRDRLRHEHEFGSDHRRDGDPPRGPEDARRTWW